MNEFTLENQILKQKKLSKEENLNLILMAQAGDSLAMEKAVLYNGKLVLQFIKKYYYLANVKEDLLQVGLISITDAIHKFDASRCVAFSTFAMAYIKNNIYKYLKRSYEFIAIPDGLSEIIIKIRKYIKINNDIPSDIELRTKFSLSEKHLQYIKIFMLPQMSIYDELPSATMQVEKYLEQIPDNNTTEIVERNDFSNCIHEIINETLNDIDRQIITMRFGLNGQNPCTLKTIANTLGLSRSRIEQREAVSLRKLRREAKKQQLYLYLK